MFLSKILLNFQAEEHAAEVVACKTQFVAQKVHEDRENKMKTIKQNKKRLV